MGLFIIAVVVLVIGAIIVAILMATGVIKIGTKVVPMYALPTPQPVQTPQPMPIFPQNVYIERPVFPEHEQSAQQIIAEMKEHPIGSAMVYPETVSDLLNL